MTVWLITMGTAWAVFAIGMVTAWVLERRSGNAGWIDVAWTLSLTAAVVSGLAAYSLMGGPLSTDRIGLVAILLLLWSTRLAGHLWRRSDRIGDDPRYAALRAEWGDRTPRRMAELLQWQAFLSLPMVFSTLTAATVPSSPSAAGTAPGLIICCTGLLICWKADRDLTRFKASRTGLCTEGLWKLSRHPNYVGEIVFWAGIALLGWDWGPIAGFSAVGPITIYVLLRFVSGIPPLEAHMAAKYGAAFAQYRDSTPALFPRLPSRR